jgi:hypothetical protein
VRKRNLRAGEFVVQGTSGRLCDTEKFGSVSVRTASLSHFAGGFGIAFAALEQKFAADERRQAGRLPDAVTVGACIF